MLIVKFMCLVLKIESVCNFYYTNELYPNNKFKDNINLQFYHGSTVYDYTTINIRNGLDLLKQNTFDNSLKTVFYCPGYSEQPSQHISGDSVDPFVKAMKVSQKVNLVVVNYEKLVEKYLFQGNDTSNANRNLGYFKAVKDLPGIGKFMFKFAKDFVKACQCQQRIHIIGFSLGAHVASHMGQGVKSLGYSIARITGLEPAQPLIEGLPTKRHLTKNDAEFVDIVHSDRGFWKFGWNQHCGTVDFWANGGTPPQPECAATPTDVCSHYMSTKYWFESINNPKNFLSRKCKDANTWQANQCTQTDTTYFGYFIDTSITGDYFFSTNAQSIYGKQAQSASP